MIPKHPLTFKEATDILTRTPSVTLARIADTFGVQLATIARARIGTEHRRSPPLNWEGAIAQLAEVHALELDERAQELRTLAKQLRLEGRV